MNFDKNIKFFAYKITGDPTEADHNQHYSEEIENILHDTYQKIQKGKIKDAESILKLIRRYPNVPAFKNYLSVFYVKKDEVKKAMNVNLAIVEEYPDYLFGKLNLCAKYFENGDLEEIPKILGDALDLKDLYPNRNVFHQHEFSSFLNISCRYLILTRNFEAVESRLEPATQVLGKNHPSIINLSELLEEEKYNYAQEQYELKMQQQEDARDEFFKKDYAVLQTEQAPTFQHKEILELYKNGINIDKSILEKILSLPRKTLLEDLEKVVEDSMNRYIFFREKDVDERGDETFTFPLHALSLLVELDAKEKLPFIIKHFSEAEYIIDFWYDDHMYETIWKFVYHLGQDDLEKLKEYIKDKNISSFAKTVICQTLNQIAQHQPKRKDEVVEWFHDVLNFFLENIHDPLFCDIVVVSSVFGEVHQLDEPLFLPIAKRFYDLNRIDLSLIGDYEEYKSLYENKELGGRKVKLFENIFDHYQEILTTWHGFETKERLLKERADIKQEIAEIEQEIAELKKENAAMDAEIREYKQKLNEGKAPSISNTKKVGRNEPCPCGSGKKYKKCCL